MKGLILVVLLAILGALVAGPVGAGVVLVVGLPVWLVAMALQGAGNAIRAAERPLSKWAERREQKLAHRTQKGKHSACPLLQKGKPCLYPLCSDPRTWDEPHHYLAKPA